jgi:hypothetical protein
MWPLLKKAKRVAKKATGSGTSLRNGPPLHRPQLAKNKSVGKRRPWMERTKVALHLNHIFAYRKSFLALPARSVGASHKFFKTPHQQLYKPTQQHGGNIGQLLAALLNSRWHLHHLRPRREPRQWSQLLPGSLPLEILSSSIYVVSIPQHPSLEDPRIALWKRELKRF